MHESITFTMTITKKITEVIKFATEKLVNDKLQSYCDYDEMIAEQFENWLNEEDIEIDSKKGTIDVYNDSDYMEHDNIYIIEEFVRDIAATIPDCEFSGCIYYADSLETTIKMNFKKTKDEFESDEVYLDDGDFEEDEDEECDEEITQDIPSLNQDANDIFKMEIESVFSLGSVQIIAGNVIEGSVFKNDIISIDGAEFVVKEITYNRKNVNTASAGMDIGLSLNSVTGTDCIEQGATFAYKY